VTADLSVVLFVVAADHQFACTYALVCLVSFYNLQL
jgi:hypothetical protein